VARLKAALLQAAARSCIYESFTHLPEYCRLAANWASREPDVVAKVDTVLAAGGVTRDEVMAKTLAWKLDEFERIDRVIAGCEARRNVALREIDRHRATLAAALRQAADAALDVEFRENPPRLTEGEARDERP